MSQKEVVFKYVSEIADTSEKVELTTSQKKEITQLIAEDLYANKDSELSKEAQDKYPTVEALAKSYVPGLLNNWLRKDTRLNGGAKYETKNPGSRAGMGDPQIREMNKLLKQFKTDPSNYADKITILEEAIESRKSEIGEKTK